MCRRNEDRIEKVKWKKKKKTTTEKSREKARFPARADQSWRLKLIKWTETNMKGRYAEISLRIFLRMITLMHTNICRWSQGSLSSHLFFTLEIFRRNIFLATTAERETWNNALRQSSSITSKRVCNFWQFFPQVPC